jgi:Zn-dependent peptidase ImmA (M78 family)
MTDNEEIATMAYRGALDVRKRAEVPRLDPVNIFDCAEKLKVEVRFIVGGTFEGMYEKERKVIVLPVDRPAGRRVFTCADELAHWRYKHGSMLDDSTTVEDYNSSPEERLANMFAGYLLMPPPAVEDAAKALGVGYSNCSAEQIYELASWFGVSYASMLGHLKWALRKISSTRYEQLKRVAPRENRSRLLAGKQSQHLIVMNKLSPRIPIDMEVGDLALLPAGVTNIGKSLNIIESTSTHTLIESMRPGVALLRTIDGSWSAAARIMRRSYTGRAVFRNLESDDDE